MYAYSFTQACMLSMKRKNAISPPITKIRVLLPSNSGDMVTGGTLEMITLLSMVYDVVASGGSDESVV